MPFYKLPDPEFDSELVTLLFEIERLRANIGSGTTPDDIFFELKSLFDTFMSVISARIEGNHTTVFETLENADLKNRQQGEQRFKEIENILKAAHYIDRSDMRRPLSHDFIRKLHELVVEELDEGLEGDATPGSYRSHEVAITGSDHRPPLAATVHAEISSLLDFVNIEMPLNRQMLQIAQAHHRFVWIHPFGNGNGRVARLFTYAMLRRTIFANRGAIALNPTSVFGNDRLEYVKALNRADRIEETGDIEWATFFVRGIKNDLDRLVHLQQHEFVQKKLVQPVITALRVEHTISDKAEKVLLRTLAMGSLKAGDLVDIFPGTATQRSREIAHLVTNGFLRTSSQGPRFYTLNISGGPIARKLIGQLDKLGFLPKILSDD